MSCGDNGRSGDEETSPGERKVSPWGREVVLCAWLWTMLLPPPERFFPFGAGAGIVKRFKESYRKPLSGKMNTGDSLYAI